MITRNAIPFNPLRNWLSFIISAVKRIRPPSLFLYASERRLYKEAPLFIFKFLTYVRTFETGCTYTAESMRGLHICISAGARGAAANRNAVIMDALPATVVQQSEGARAGIWGTKGTR